MVDLAKADPQVPAARVVTNQQGDFLRLELNGEPFEPFMSADHPIRYERWDAGAGLLHIALIVSGYSEVVED